MLLLQRLRMMRARTIFSSQMPQKNRAPCSLCTRGASRFESRAPRLGKLMGFGFLFKVATLL